MFPFLSFPPLCTSSLCCVLEFCATDYNHYCYFFYISSFHIYPWAPTQVPFLFFFFTLFLLYCLFLLHLLHFFQFIFSYFLFFTHVSLVNLFCSLNCIKRKKKKNQYLSFYFIYCYLFYILHPASSHPLAHTPAPS